MLPKILQPTAQPIDHAFVARKLANIRRFNGHPGAISVAQHATLGAEAILAEGGTAFEAELFLHHDDHEFALGDLTRDVEEALGMLAPDFPAAWRLIRESWDRAIYASLGRPAPEAWTPKQARTVTMMDLRMRTCEMRALFGPAAIAEQSAEARRTPRFNASLSPAWPAELAAERYLDMHRKLTGRIIR